MDTILVCTLLYCIIVGLLYAPRCPQLEAAGNFPIDYFPSVEEEEEEEEYKLTEEKTSPCPPPSAQPLTIRELKQLASRAKIKNYSRMNKAQLISALG